MQTQSIQTMGQMVDYIGSLPQVEQKQIFGLIDEFMTQKNQFAKPISTSKKRTAGTLKGKVVFTPDFDSFYFGEK